MTEHVRHRCVLPKDHSLTVECVCKCGATRDLAVTHGKWRTVEPPPPVAPLPLYY